MRLVWVTDPHFDCLKLGKTIAFGKMVANSGDNCVITGDIGHGDSVCSFLYDFQRGFGGDVFFVLGNHDFWKSSFEQVQQDVRQLCKENTKLHWLGDGDVYHVGDSQLCGVDGWYDYQAGATGERINFIMNDWHLIQELKANFNVYRMGFSAPLLEQLKLLGSQSANQARATLKKCDNSKPVLFATHVPPYADAAWHEGKHSDPTHLPFYTNIALGHVLREWAYTNQTSRLTTICGHTHSPGEFVQRDNHIVYSGESHYGNPQISKVFNLS
jgi:3',5'-cyclic-AMP phosphodiesterase